MKSHHHWEAAVKAYREMASLKDQVPELQARLAAAGREVLKSMRELSHSTDISDLVKHIQEKFAGEAADAALYKLFMLPLSDPDDLRTQVESEGGGISGMFDSRFFDYEGRTVAVAPGAFSPDDARYEERIMADLQRRAAIYRGFSAQAQVANALRIVSMEHKFDAEFLGSRLADSVFIPKDVLSITAKDLPMALIGNSGTPLTCLFRSLRQDFGTSLAKSA